MISNTFISLFIGVVFCCATGPLSWAADENAQSPSALFQQGLESFQKKDFEAAKETWTQVLSKDPRNLSVLSNLGLLYYQLGKRGLSLGYARRTLALDGSNISALQLTDFIANEGKVHELPRHLDQLEMLHESLLGTLSFSSLVGIFLLIAFSFLWILLGYLGARKRALAIENAPPRFSFVAMITGALLFVSLCLTLAKWLDLQATRATIVVEKTSALTAPSDQSPSLFELTEGLEVVVRKTQNEWAQVTYPGGMTGWIKMDSMMITTSNTELSP